MARLTSVRIRLSSEGLGSVAPVFRSTDGIAKVKADTKEGGFDSTCSVAFVRRSAVRSSVEVQKCNQMSAAQTVRREGVGGQKAPDLAFRAIGQNPNRGDRSP